MSISPAGLQSAILTSVVLNLMKDGKADISALSPYVQEYLMGIIQDYNESSDDEKHNLYWYAHAALSEISNMSRTEGILH